MCWLRRTRPTCASGRVPHTHQELLCFCFPFTASRCLIGSAVHNTRPPCSMLSTCSMQLGCSLRYQLPVGPKRPQSGRVWNSQDSANILHRYSALLAKVLLGAVIPTINPKQGPRTRHKSNHLAAPSAQRHPTSTGRPSPPGSQQRCPFLRTLYPRAQPRCIQAQSSSDSHSVTSSAPPPPQSRSYLHHSTDYRPRPVLRSA